jgi:hypothetical protein
MEDPRTRQLKANYNQEVTRVARNVYLKMKEVVRDLEEAGIKKEDKDEIAIYLVGMIVKGRKGEKA